MKKKIKTWVKMNKAFVIWTTVILVYTGIMLAIIIAFMEPGDAKGFRSKVNEAQTETVTEWRE